MRKLLMTTMLAAVALPAQAGETCWRDAETHAAHVRELHAEMMVGALICRSSDAQMTGHYNAFTSGNRATLDRGNAQLKLHFMRTGGVGAGLGQYDSYVTQVANRHAERARASGAAFCDEQRALYEIASRASEAELDALAEASGVTAPVDQCAIPIPAAATASASATVAPVATSAAVTALAPPAPVAIAVPASPVIAAQPVAVIYLAPPAPAADTAPPAAPASTPVAVIPVVAAASAPPSAPAAAQPETARPGTYEVAPGVFFTANAPVRY